MISVYILIIFVICLITIIDNKLIIKPSESIILRDQFKPFVALCTGQENIRVVSWQSPLQINIEENSNARITIERKSFGLRLRIRNLTENEQGTWTCLGFDEDNQSFSKTIQINIKIPITFVSEPIQYAELNSAVLIKCYVISNPSAEISWFKGEDKLNILSSNYEQKNNGLKINRVSLRDNDTFWCQADVSETGESKDYQIQVILAQAITSTKITCMTPCAVEKRTATLICEANGVPQPQYSWFYGQDGPFTINGVSKFIIRGNRLIINYVDETDNGRYSCHAFNDYDKKGQKIGYILNVIIPLSLAPISQIQISLDENSPSQRITFSCRVQRGSTTNLSLEWLYANNTLVQPINGLSIDSTQLTTHHLIELNFDPIRREHHGNYTCLGKNLGDSTSTIAHLIVQYKPVLIEPKMNYVYSVLNYPGKEFIFLKNIRILLSSTVIMKCRFDSYPPPVIQWRKFVEEYNDNEIILNNNDLQVIDISFEQIESTIYETQLIYKPIEEEDFRLKFQCQADNSRIEKHLITLRRAELPREARITKIKPNSTSIELNVQPPTEFGGLPLLNYIVKYEEINIPNSVKTLSFPVLSNNSQLIQIESLQVSSLYRIEIAVESIAGQSVYSIPVQAKTFDGNIPQFNLTMISCFNNNFYLIKWFIEYDGGSNISKIELFYAKRRSINKIEKWSKPILIESHLTEYELKELKSKTNYLIIVRLFNKAGYGERMIEKTIVCKMYDPQQASIWVIIGIITIIIIGTISIFIIFIVNRILCECKSSSFNDHSKI
ncbi:unnamed protein product [Adineta steineri]|uniref:Uncharacterized protein n=1 Tax=Adineta steineri TaxID=433720 RepID=A0A814I810_9BILA|nr:unnamed protein product [Adineta steineri]